MVSPRTLGRGFAATVYLAEDVEKKKQVACKIVRSFRWDFDIDDEQQQSESQAIIDERRKVMREVKILAQLNHVRNVLPFHKFVFMFLMNASHMSSTL